MTSFQNIVVATDFSVPSELAAQAAQMIDGGEDTRVTLLHVVNTPELDPGTIEQRAVVAQELETAVHGHLDSVRDTFLKNMTNVKTAIIRSNNAADAICEFASEVGADLVLMGTTGRTGIARFLIGSVAERVVRHAPCPVMVLRAKA